MPPTRRQVLLGTALLPAACTSSRRPSRRTPSPDDQLRADAVARERALVQAYVTAMQQHPELAHLLEPVLGDHSAHLAALGAPEPSPTPSATGTPTSAPPSAPTAAARRNRAAALASLAAQERAAAAAHAAAALTADPAARCASTLAPVLASLAASEASHAAVLA